MKSEDQEERVQNRDVEQAELDRFIDSHRAFLEEVSRVLGSTASPKLTLASPEERPTPTREQ